MKKILVTGCAGFIGYHVVKNLLLDRNYIIYGIDNINDYYDVKIKKHRINLLKNFKRKFIFYKFDLSNSKKLEQNFKKNNYDYVIHLAAQAGVRYSITNPQAYFKSNISSFFNIIQVCVKFKIKHFIYASTSSVYGDANNFPLKEKNLTDSPLTFYAASKKTNEILAYSYSNIYKLRCTGLRFFTVYGPLGRPDMSIFLFTKSIINNKFIKLHNNGNHTRDFTYVDDIAISISKLIKKPSNSRIPFNTFNIGNGSPVHLMKVVHLLEKIIGKKAKIKKLKMQKGDVLKTHSDISKLKSYIGYKPYTNISKGLKEFVKWFKEYYNYD